MSGIIRENQLNKTTHFILKKNPNVTHEVITFLNIKVYEIPKAAERNALLGFICWMGYQLNTSKQGKVSWEQELVLLILKHPCH